MTNDLGPDHTADKGTLYEEGRKWHRRALNAEAINAELLAALKSAACWIEVELEGESESSVHVQMLDEMRAIIRRAEEQ